jgi:hypothetical protein
VRLALDPLSCLRVPIAPSAFRLVEKTLIVPAIPLTTKQDEKRLSALSAFLDSECEEEQTECEESRSIERLSKDKLLVSQLGRRGAYNAGYYFWVVHDKPPYNSQPVADGAANEYSKGIIIARQKGRGLGDCWYMASWAWTGNRFDKAEESSTGMCKGFPGGAWELPTIVNKVVSEQVER